MDVSGVIEIIKLSIPAIAVIFGIQYVLKSLKEKEINSELIQMNQKKIEIVLPLRLQAYERMCMFLERIRLDSVMMRVNQPNHNAASIQKAILDDIRTEYNHNLSQQVYLSQNAWSLIRNATEATKGIVISTYQELNHENASSQELIKNALNKYFSYNSNPIDEALEYIKLEIQEKF